MTFEEMGLRHELLRAIERTATPNPPRSRPRRSPARERGPRPAGLRPDRHRQDRRLRAADPPAPGGEPHGARANAVRGPDPGADARTGDPDRRQLPRATAGTGPASRRSSSAASATARRSSAARAASTSWSPRRAGCWTSSERRAHRLRSTRSHPRARRGRPDARHGLHPRRPQDRRDLLPDERQTLFFSATMPTGRSRAWRRTSSNDPVRVEVTPPATRRSSASTSASITSTRGAKRALLDRPDPADRAMARVLVFTRTKHGADRVARQLRAAPASRPPRSTATSRQGQRAARARRLPRRASCASWWRPTSPRAASTSTTSRTSSTTSCRTSRRTTSTASAAPRAPAPTASRSRCATRSERGSLRGDRAADLEEADLAGERAPVSHTADTPGPTRRERRAARAKGRARFGGRG